MLFDEGGIGLRFRHCPIQLYNAKKSKKYHIDVFVLCEAEEDNMFDHLDLYQGRNSNNVNITTLHQAFPTTAKAVLNTVEKTGFKKIQDGY